jgi:hypothetical protein
MTRSCWSAAPLFQMDWTDVQSTVRLPHYCITFVTHAGVARFRAGELDVSGQPWPALTLRSGAGLDDAVITSAGCSGRPGGSRVYQMPRRTWDVGGTITHPLLPGLPALSPSMPGTWGTVSRAPRAAHASAAGLRRSGARAPASSARCLAGRSWMRAGMYLLRVLSARRGRTAACDGAQPRTRR